MASPVSVKEYVLLDRNAKPISMCVLPLWSEKTKSIGDLKTDFYLEGVTGNGVPIKKITEAVIAWRFELSSPQPEIFVLSKEGELWFALQNPRKSFETTVRQVLVTVHWMHFMKWKYDKVKAPEISVWNHLQQDLRAHDDGGPGQNGGGEISDTSRGIPVPKSSGTDYRYSAQKKPPQMELLNPISIEQPKGPSFRIEDGHRVKWANWEFHLKADQRAGLMYKGFASELFLPYTDLDESCELGSSELTSVFTHQLSEEEVRDQEWPARSHDDEVDDVLDMMGVRRNIREQNRMFRSYGVAVALWPIHWFPREEDIPFMLRRDLASQGTLSVIRDHRVVFSNGWLRGYEDAAFL
ncbi:Copper amine oxidase [Corchorus capsularis]|uniref:Copper amine oxidase n=1 Tax=Corchorus capsularis TaxID=210143 RepID=A0A1R3G1F5_COCAP|nr:Copper amine oxidase [Corchorus capsularis]